MKFLLVVRSVGHWPYIRSIVKELSKNNECKVDLLFDKTWSKGLMWNEKDGINFGWQRTRELNRFILTSREFRSYVNYIRWAKKYRQSEYYIKRWNSYLPSFLSCVSYTKPARFILKHNQVFKWLTRLEDLVAPDDDIVDDIIKRNPDLVFVTPMNMRFSNETDYAKAAKALKIPVATSILSWDNLTTKGTYSVIPDKMFVWNYHQAHEATHIHNIPFENIEVSGAPFFDKWIKCEHLLEKRKEFCYRVGLDHKKKFFVYLGSSKNIADNESHIIRELSVLLSNKFQILVKPHIFEATWSNYKKFDGQLSVLYSPMPETEQTRKDLYNAIKHSEFAVGINTSAMIDAVVLDKRCFALVLNEFNSTQSSAEHFKIMCRSGAFEVCRSEKELRDRVVMWQDNRKNLRNDFTHNLIKPNNVSAGEYISDRLKSMIKNV